MARIRVKKVESLIREEAADFVLNELADPRLGFLTVTQVECTSDLSHAKIFISVLGSDAQQRTSLRALESAQKALRARVGRVLDIRRVPEIEVILDTGAEKSIRMSELIEQARAGDADHAEAEESEDEA